MRAEHLRQWLISATQDDSPDANNWMKVFAIMQLEFREGTLDEKFMFQKFVITPKGRGDFRGIGLVEVLWKTVASLLNHRLTAGITYHDALHGFKVGQGTGTSALEANLIQQLTAIREAVLFRVFMDIQKAYDASYQ